MWAEDRWWEEAAFVKSFFDEWEQQKQGSGKPLQAKKRPLTPNISRRWKSSSHFHCPWPELLIWRKKCGICLKLRKFMLANGEGGGGLSKLGLSSRHTTLVSLRRAGSGAGSTARLWALGVQQEPEPALGPCWVWEPQGDPTASGAGPEPCSLMLLSHEEMLVKQLQCLVKTKLQVKTQHIST